MKRIDAAVFGYTLNGKCALYALLCLAVGAVCGCLYPLLYPFNEL
jgi:hypothetical protein